MVITVPVRESPALPASTIAADQCRPDIAPLIAVLRQLAGLIEEMTEEQYRAKPRGFSGSVGGHVRHCLDHVDALLASIEHGSLDYDSRRRGTAVEEFPQAALDAITRQQLQLLDLPWLSEERPLRLTALLSSTYPPFEYVTTVGRELAFVLSHTIHHNALIAVMANRLHVAIPSCFGYAPSTIAHLEKTTCAR